MKLAVYKASAGSGKTYTLASEYLRLALANPNSQRAFRSILAVTFTNKATEEMKARIVNLLDKLAKNEEPALANQLNLQLKLTPDKLQQRSLQLRNAILHGYSHFSIVTIDRFFQQILQAFVREAGLRPGYTVELDSDRILDEAIARVWEDASSDSSLYQWLLTLVEANIDAGKTWNITPKLKDLGREVFSESYLYFSDTFKEKLGSKATLNSYLNNLNQLVSDFEQQMKLIGSEALQYIASCQLAVSDFKYGDKGAAGYFSKLLNGSEYAPTKRAEQVLADPDGWASKTSPKHIDIKAASHRLTILLEQAVNLWNTKGVLYNTALVLLKNFLYLGLFSDLSKNITLVSNEENMLPISSSVYLLNRLISDSDTPFIYEKTGVQFRHIMIDEFQDTSRGQWHNFLPLVRNSLAEGNFSMVVGDVKQAIYRWRNGDWKILGHQLPYDFSSYGIAENELSANWRSKGIIITYNNALFATLSASLQQTINNELDTLAIAEERKAALQRIVTSAYSQTKQQLAPNTKVDEGFVSIEVVSNEEERKSTDIVLEKLPMLIADLEDRGYEPKDIAILVRRGVEGQQVADTLLSHKQQSGDTAHCFDVISQDSLFLANASVVKLVIAILRLATNASNDICETFICHELYLRQQNDTVAETSHSRMQTRLSAKDKHVIASLSEKPMTEAFELLIQHFGLNSKQNDLPFLQALHDVVLRYSTDHLADIGSFVRWWDEKESAKAVLSANDKQNAIRILTIHKSKGLQFKVVVIPFCSWSLTPKNDSILWLSPKVEPFNELEYIPVGYTKALADTIFYEDYFNEKAQSFVDNLNLLYVACTRAEDELHIMVPQPARKQEQAVGSLLEGIVEAANHDTFVFGEGMQPSDTSPNLLTFGTKTVVEKTAATAAQAEQQLPITQYPSNPLHSKLKIHYESLGFFSSEDVTMSPKAYGSLMHRIFSNIKTVDDITSAVNQVYAEGLIDKGETSLYEQKTREALSFPAASGWFSGEWELKNEAEFLLPKNKAASLRIRRPDRVMINGSTACVIDYKFGTIERTEYQQQVKSYMQGLVQMGYTEVEGYIWYVDTKKVVPVIL